MSQPPKNHLASNEVTLLFFVILLMGIGAFTLGYYMGIRNPSALKPEALPPGQRELSQTSSPKNEVVENNQEQRQEENLAKLAPVVEKESGEVVEEEISNSEKPYKLEVLTPEENKYSGRYSILVGTFTELEDAQNFGEGFVVRGYAPIIREVDLEGIGVRYKISLGAFDTEQEAKNYLKEEESLFGDSDYPIEIID